MIAQCSSRWRCAGVHSVHGLTQEEDCISRHASRQERASALMWLKKWVNLKLYLFITSSNNNNNNNFSNRSDSESLSARARLFSTGFLFRLSNTFCSCEKLRHVGKEHFVTAHIYWLYAFLVCLQNVGGCCYSYSQSTVTVIFLSQHVPECFTPLTPLLHLFIYYKQRHIFFTHL